jgi:hypothetical protein
VQLKLHAQVQINSQQQNFKKNDNWFQCQSMHSTDIVGLQHLKIKEQGKFFSLREKYVTNLNNSKSDQNIGSFLKKSHHIMPA